MVREFVGALTEYILYNLYNIYSGVKLRLQSGLQGHLWIPESRRMLSRWDSEMCGLYYTLVPWGRRVYITFTSHVTSIGNWFLRICFYMTFVSSNSTWRVLPCNFHNFALNKSLRNMVYIKTLFEGSRNQKRLTIRNQEEYIEGWTLRCELSLLSES